MFIRIKMVGGRPYRYLEERFREGGKVRSRSTYLGPASSTPSAPPSLIASLFALVLGPVIPEEERGLAYIEKLVEKYPGDPFATKAAELKAAVVPAVPVVPASPVVQSPNQPADASTQGAPSAPGDTSE